MRNVLAHAGKSGRRVVSAFIAAAFVQETPEAASVQWRAVADTKDDVVLLTGICVSQVLPENSSL